MPTMTENKTKPTEASVADFLAGVEPARKRDDALALDRLFRRVTGWQPRLWGPSMIGYGAYHYVYDSGREGDFLFFQLCGQLQVAWCRHSYCCCCCSFFFWLFFLTDRCSKFIV